MVAFSVTIAITNSHVHVTLQLKMKKTFAESQKARETLKIIQTLTYTCDDGDALSDLNCKLNEALCQLKKCIPSSDGIIVRPAIAQRTKNKSQIQRAKRIAQKYSSLQLLTKKGPKRLDSAYRNRVGKKASSLRKVRITIIITATHTFHHAYTII